MILRTLRNRGSSETSEVLPGVQGVARVSRTVGDSGDVVARLRPGEIAVIDQIDLDRRTARQLLTARAGAVVNAATSSTGRYPNLGPATLVEAGVPLLDQVGRDLLAEVRDGDRLRLHGGTLYRGEQRIGIGIEQTAETVQQAQQQARDGMVTQLEAVAAGAIEHLRTEHELFLEGVGVPTVRTRFARRHAVVVTGNPDSRQELRNLRVYLRDHDPVLIGVDEGADVLLAAGRRPDLVLGRLDTVSEDALRCGAELVAHADRHGDGPAADRLERLGLSAVRFDSIARPEALAMLLARTAGAELVVVVGAPATLLEFLDTGSTKVASVFLTRMALTGRVVDARGLARMRRSSPPGWGVALLFLASVIALLTAVLLTPAGADWLDPTGIRLDGVVDWLRGLVP